MVFQELFFLKRTDFLWLIFKYIFFGMKRDIVYIIVILDQTADIWYIPNPCKGYIRVGGRGWRFDYHMERELNLELSKGEGKLNLELALRGLGWLSTEFNILLHLQYSHTTTITVYTWFNRTKKLKEILNRRRGR